MVHIALHFWIHVGVPAVLLHAQHICCGHTDMEVP